MDIKNIKENYTKFDDEKIIRIAEKDFQSLRPEVLDILKSEINKRKLPNELIVKIDSEINSSETKINELIDKNNTFLISNGLINYTAFFLTIAIGILSFKFLNRGIAVLSLPLIFIGLRKFIKMRAEIVKLGKENLTITLHSGYRIIFLIKLVSNSLNKITVDYKKIEKIYKGNGIFNDRTYYIIVNEKNESFEKMTLLHTLDKNNDLELLKKLLTHKKVVFEI